jgi:hypothetical protein
VELVPRTTAPLHATGAVEFVPLSAIAADPAFRLRDPGDPAGLSALAASIARLGQLVPVELRPLPGAPDGPVRYQVVAGFRRLAAVRLLARERVLARVHQRLDDEDAWSLALAQALLGEPLTGPELEALRTRLDQTRLAPWAEDLVDEALVRLPVPADQREKFLQFLRGVETPDAGPAVDEDEAVAAAEVEEAPPAAAPAPAPAASAPTPEVAPGPEPEPEAASEPELEAEPADQGPEEITPEELAADLATRFWEVNQDLSLAVDAWDELPAEGRRMILEQTRYVAELYQFLAGGRRR